MSNPAVSVIIPCYNAEKTLDECIGSLLNQTMQNIEIICVDDGSTDNTLKKLQNYARTDMRVRIFSQQNQYAGAARNLGMAQAKGEYILFLDADDFFAESLAQEPLHAFLGTDRGHMRQQHAQHQTLATQCAQAMPQIRDHI